ncbi:CsbD family protein [Anaerosporobacter sp.]
MNNENGKLDKIAGTIKEATGKVINSEQLELEGKLQKIHGEMKETTKELKEDLKEKAAEKVNDFIDKKDIDKQEK